MARHVRWLWVYCEYNWGIWLITFPVTWLTKLCDSQSQTDFYVAYVWTSAWGVKHVKCVNLINWLGSNKRFQNILNENHDWITYFVKAWLCYRDCENPRLVLGMKMLHTSWNSSQFSVVKSAKSFWYLMRLYKDDYWNKFGSESHLNEYSLNVLYG